MTTVNHRHERIGEEIAHEINAMLAGELKDPRLEISVVVNQVLIAQDMRHARVLVGARGTQAEQKGAIKALEHAANFIRHEIVEPASISTCHFPLSTLHPHSYVKKIYAAPATNCKSLPTGR